MAGFPFPLQQCFRPNMLTTKGKWEKGSLGGKEMRGKEEGLLGGGNSSRQQQEEAAPGLHVPRRNGNVAMRQWPQPAAAAFLPSFLSTAAALQ